MLLDILFIFQNFFNGHLTKLSWEITFFTSLFTFLSSFFFYFFNLFFLYFFYFLASSWEARPNLATTYFGKNTPGELNQALRIRNWVTYQLCHKDSFILSGWISYIDWSFETNNSNKRCWIYRELNLSLQFWRWVCYSLCHRGWTRNAKTFFGNEDSTWLFLLGQPLQYKSPLGASLSSVESRTSSQARSIRLWCIMSSSMMEKYIFQFFQSSLILLLLLVSYDQSMYEIHPDWKNESLWQGW